MAGFERRTGPAAPLVMALLALGVGGCAHHAHRSEAARSYGSLKDDLVAAKPAVASPAAAPMPATASAPRVLPPIRTPSPVKPAAAAAMPASEREKEPVAPSAVISPGDAARKAERDAQPPRASTIAPPAPGATPSRPSAQPPQVPAPDVPLPPVLDAAGVERLLVEGQRLFEQGKVLEARRRFIAAMNGPVPEVLLALARSYDTYYLSRLPSADASPDMQRALVLYERAVERGAIEANADLERTRGILRVPPR